jgi:uncharacterized membrane protein
MPTPDQLVPTAFSLVAVLCWGTSDFLGGYAAKRSDSFLVTLLSHVGGFVLMATLVMASHAVPPARASQLWAVAAGSLGGVGLAMLYRALASGRMGLAAPVAAVLGAAIPTMFGIVVEGCPGVMPVSGFLLAGIGIWLISRPEGRAGRDGLGLAFLAGLGFAGFFLCINQTGAASAVWSSAISRFASLVLVGIIVLARGSAAKVRRMDAVLAITAGFLDSTGTLVFIRAEQTGRLDAAVVLTSLYPAITVLLARAFLKEHFSRWRVVGMIAALVAVPLVAG